MTQQEGKVQFTDDVEIITAPSGGKQGESQDLWYTQDDYRSFRSENKSKVSDLSDSLSSIDFDPTENTDCLRGLESSPDKRKRNQLVKAVLDLQKELVSNGIVDHKGISALSKRMSRTDKEVAIALGAIDEFEAARVWDEEGDGLCECTEGEYFQLSKTLMQHSIEGTVPPFRQLQRTRSNSRSPGKRFRKRHAEHKPVMGLAA